MGEAVGFETARKLKLLVVIASYGDRNLGFLKRIIGNYQGMDFDVRIIVLSERAKDCGPGIEVRVGLPSKNPWSLPFGHKKIFADNVNDFELFAYSEDDIEVTENNLRSFLAVTPFLNSDEIAGFLRFENNADGTVSIPEAHGVAHWKPETVAQRGEVTVAEFSNEHAAFYLLTRLQLKAAIASGGFLREPYAGRYDMLCSAATDPYTCCGFRKVICISKLDSFLIHHLPNRYAGCLGVELNAFKEQVHTLLCIARGAHPARTLCPVEPKIPAVQWAKSFYEKPNEEVLQMISRKPAHVLSIGCGSGELEGRLLERGQMVTALPLDSVIGAAAARRGVEVFLSDLKEGLDHLEGRRFGAILLSNILLYFDKPFEVLRRCARLLAPCGRLIIVSPNFELLPVLVRRSLAVGEYKNLADFTKSGIHLIVAADVIRWLQREGLSVHSAKWTNVLHHQPTSGALSAVQRMRSLLGNKLFRNGTGRLTADTWIVCGER